MNGNQPTKHWSWSNQQVILVRVGVGIWLLILSAILYRTGAGGLWELLLVAVATLHFGLAYRVFRFAKHDPDRRLRFR
jgi:hypothetical protein